MTTANLSNIVTAVSEAQCVLQLVHDQLNGEQELTDEKVARLQAAMACAMGRLNCVHDLALAV